MAKRKISAERALYIAAGKGDLEKVKSLLTAGANIHEWNEAALVKACWRGRLEVVKYMLEKDGDRADIHGSNDLAVREAALKNRWDVVKYLVEKGANVRADDYLAWCQSVLYGNPDTVKFLLDNGTDVHARNDWAVEAAALNGRQNIVVVLVDWIFRAEAWEGRHHMDAHREGDRLAAILEKSVSPQDCKGNAIATGAMVGAAAAVAVIMERSAAAAKRLRGPEN